MFLADKYYKENLTKILNEGCKDENPRPKYKDGTPAHSLYITKVFECYDISKGEIPLTTLRNTAIKTGIQEIFWIYQDRSNKLFDAHKRNITWWDDWNIGDGTIGNRYGYTVNKWSFMSKLLMDLEYDTFSRRIQINLLQESDLTSTKGLYPCAYGTNWSVRKIDDNIYLDVTLHQRSNDYIMAGYINKIQYLAFQMMVAGHLGFKVGKFCHMVENLHIYDRHISAAHEILERDSHEIQPTIELPINKNFYAYTIDDFIIKNSVKHRKLISELELAV